MTKCFADSSIYTPLIFVLSSGSDPVGNFNTFSENMEMKLIHSISLG